MSSRGSAAPQSPRRRDAPRRPRHASRAAEGRASAALCRPSLVFGRTAQDNSHRRVASAAPAPGVLNIVHGTHGAVNGVCDHPDIKAVSFVGGNGAGRHVARRATEAGKRIQINMASGRVPPLAPTLSQASLDINMPDTA